MAALWLIGGFTLAFLFEARATGHEGSTYGQRRPDRDSGVHHDDSYPDDPEDQPGGKGLPPGTNKFQPPMDHTCNQEAYINHSNERYNGYAHYFNIAARRFYRRHMRQLATRPEAYAIALAMFLRRHYRHRRAFQRSDLIEPHMPNAYDYAQARLARDAARARQRKRGRDFLSS